MTKPAFPPRETLTDGHLSRQIDLPADVLSAGEARAFVRETLDDWGYAEVKPEATLAVSELVTNAVIHAQSPTQVILTDLDGAIQLKVCDEKPEPPTVVHARETDVHGRGMMLVDSVSDSWGVEERPPGKAIWLDITAH